MQSGELIGSVGGKPLTTAEDALAAWADLQAGRSVPVEIDRQGTRQTLTFNL